MNLSTFWRRKKKVGVILKSGRANHFHENRTVID